MGPRDHPGCAVQSHYTAQGGPQGLVSSGGEEVRGPVTEAYRERTQSLAMLGMLGSHQPQMVCGPGKKQDG